jgi:flavin-dependent thymidylate synthase
LEQYKQSNKQGNEAMKIILTMTTPEIAIGENAKICYGTKSVEDGGKDITSSLVHGHGHLASLRFAYATVYVEGISVACQNQLVRSKHLDFMVQSKRYVKPEKGGFEFIMPKGLSLIHQDAMRAQWDAAIALYKRLLSEGVDKENARAILPSNTSTKMNITGNLQAWNDMFKLRLNTHAQHEIREVAEAIFNLLQEAYPQIFTEDVRTRYRGA